MTIHDPHLKTLHELAETRRKVAVSNRMGVIKEVKQEGGEQKVRVVIGVDPQGKELVGPWMSTVDKRGATREQHQYKKGQNVRISGADADYRQGTVSAWAEGESFPQPDSAEDHGYGDSYQAGKLHTGAWMPEEEEEQQQQDSKSGQQSQQKSDGKQKEKNHRYEIWIAEEDNAPPKHAGKSREEQQSASGGQQEQQQQEQKKEKKKPKAAMMVSVDEKNGYTARVGTDVRVAAHKDGAKVRAGETYFVAEKDKDAKLYAKKDVYVRALGKSFVNKPWVIKRGKDEAIPNDDKLGNKG